MLTGIMEALTRALYDSFPAALGASFLWGLMSMILSPCHLVSVPLVMGYLGSGTIERRCRCELALLFALGMTISIAVIGVVTSLLGRIAGDIGNAGSIIMAFVLVYVGVAISGRVSLPVPGISRQHMFTRKGRAGAFLMGLVLGAALGPCTFAFMAPVLALMFSMGSERLLQAILLGCSFAVGHGIVVIFAGSFSDRVQRLLHWSGSSRTAGYFRIICGSLVVLGGLYLLYGVFLRS